MLEMASRCLLGDVETAKKMHMEDMMKQTPQTYVLTLNSPSGKALRLWTGTSFTLCATALSNNSIVR